VFVNKITGRKLQTKNLHGLVIEALESSRLEVWHLNII
tara:strand:+ start:932 stop:1045 length:114 start_codon:yes stop_codon:yes gene_type:complete